jgi:hypothetical protein
MKGILSIYEYVSFKLTTPSKLSVKYKLLLLAFSIGGVVLSLLSTSLYGAGLSPDSIYYLSAARNIAEGNGVTSFDGNAFILWPPLYPILLAIPFFTLNVDPLTDAHLINAFLHGLIIYFSGLLLSRHLFSNVAFTILGVVVILVSNILLDISTMAWSETLFIFFVLVFLYYIEKFLEKKDWISFVFFSLSAALACLTRYIGMSLIATGVVLLFFFYREKFNVKLFKVLLFIFLSFVPIGIWLVRNHFISGTLFGGRNPSVVSFSHNIGLVYSTMLNWGYFPPKEHWQRVAFLIIFVILTCSFAFFLTKGSLTRIRTQVKQFIPIGLFIIFYLSFLLYSSTTYAFEAINWRYLSPIYVPVTILLLLTFDILMEPIRGRISPLIVAIVQVLALGIWLIHSPVKSTKIYIYNWKKYGTAGYSQKEWRESEIVKYLKNHKLDSGHLVFTNDPLALYILTNLKSQKEIVTIISKSSERIIQPGNADLRTVYNDYDYFIWFDNVNPQDYPYTEDQLKNSLNVKEIAHLQDGIVFSVQRSQ